MSRRKKVTAVVYSKGKAVFTYDFGIFIRLRVYNKY